MVRNAAAGGIDGPHATNFAWLLALRWGAVAGKLAIAVLVWRFLGIDLPLERVLPILGFELATNAIAWVWARGRARVPEGALVAVMALDVVLLTALLSVTGGPSNPFNFLYLVHIALAAVILPPGWTWALAGMSLACCAALFRGQSGHHLHAEDMRLHLQGMWVALAVAAVFIVYFVQRVARALAERDAELAAVRDRTARQDKLASLAALAAGAAHELSTPLSTIAVVARELERRLERERSDDSAASDTRVIRDQVERCREILSQMAADAGESAGEPLVPVAVGELVEAVLAPLPDRERVQVEVEPGVARRRLRVPLRALVRAVQALVDNARRAAPFPSPIRLRVAAEGDGCRIAVTDQGAGMTAEQLARAGDPFFTTREPGKGLGLGLFLARTLLDRIGGRLELESAPGSGTTATVHLPPGAAPSVERVAAPGGTRAE